jgi:riboflavin kinase/FMN adenylyltransferase
MIPLLPTGSLGSDVWQGGSPRGTGHARWRAASRSAPAPSAGTTLSGSLPPSPASVEIPPAVVHSGPRGAPPAEGPRALAVGNFDGVHRGHAVLVSRLREVAGALGMPAVIVTFDPHPARVVRPDAAPVPLTTITRRVELLLALGVDAVVVQPAEPRLLSLPAASFYRIILRERLRAAALVEGPDFRFGKDRAGDIATLARLSAAAGVRLEVVEPVEVGGEPVSSSRVRRLIAAGDVGGAGDLLTAAYRLTGRVVPGARRGASLGFPTANLAHIATVLPGPGVYAAWVTAADTLDASVVGHAAAVHVGPNATFGETALSVEAHLVGFAGDLYGRTLHVDFLARLRDTRRFDSVEALCAQLAVDVAASVDVVRRADAVARPSPPAT